MFMGGMVVSTIIACIPQLLDFFLSFFHAISPYSTYILCFHSSYPPSLLLSVCRTVATDPNATAIPYNFSSIENTPFQSTNLQSYLVQSLSYSKTVSHMAHPHISSQIPFWCIVGAAAIPVSRPCSSTLFPYNSHSIDSLRIC